MLSGLRGAKAMGFAPMRWWTAGGRRWGGDDPPGVVFTYQPSRAGNHAEQILLGFDGILQLDG